MFKVLIRGVEYTIKRANRSQIAQRRPADCDAPTAKSPTIQLVRGLCGQRLLNYTIHEALHACLWDLDEEAVRETAETISEILCKDGWRRIKPDIMEYENDRCINTNGKSNGKGKNQ